MARREDAVPLGDAGQHDEDAVAFFTPAFFEGVRRPVGEARDVPEGKGALLLPRGVHPDEGALLLIFTVPVHHVEPKLKESGASIRNCFRAAS